ncbi:hypothetical protein [Kitasatospora sp. NPDC093806]|uniref:hypothetical protein n=1 Tax=Kitasatospora sp. NPDC093806 TaxID=3155075 RepID=UPI00341D55BC
MANPPDPPGTPQPEPGDSADDQAWFRSPAWQAREREVDEALARGERGVVYPEGAAFIAGLHRAAHPEK